MYQAKATFNRMWPLCLVYCSVSWWRWMKYTCCIDANDLSVLLCPPQLPLQRQNFRSKGLSQAACLPQDSCSVCTKARQTGNIGSAENIFLFLQLPKPVCVCDTPEPTSHKAFNWAAVSLYNHQLKASFNHLSPRYSTRNQSILTGFDIPLNMHFFDICMLWNVQGQTTNQSKKASIHLVMHSRISIWKT